MDDSTPAEMVRPPRLRLGFLDGIRGLAALYVLIFHSLAIELDNSDESLSAPMTALRAVFGDGHFAVVVFIVLSGFSLMLPIARAGALHLNRSFWSYMQRRARRVLPAYYAALALSILSILGASFALDTGTSEEALSTGSIVSHLLLVHNLRFDWAFRINGPMWSVATEWHIYFLFPLVLLPLWRRFGSAVTVTLAWAIPLAVHFLLPDTANLFWAAPWFVGSFAFGVWGAIVAHSSSRLLRQPWAWVGLGSLGLLVVILAGPGKSSSPLLFLDFIVSAMSLALILTCVGSLLDKTSSDNLTNVTDGEPANPGPLNGILGSKPMVVLGAFSYSVYLLQHPFLRFTEAILNRTSLGYEAALWVQLIIGTPLILVASRIFAEFFEIPFTTGSRVVNSMRAAIWPRTPDGDEVGSGSELKGTTESRA